MRFECQASCEGKCCTSKWNDESSFVFLTKDDQERLSHFLGEPLTKFAEVGIFESTRFSSTRTMQWYLSNYGEKCRFFKNSKCTVYEARPTQCRTFPFWPENMASQSWQDLGKHCPGINQGQVHDDSKLTEQLRADRELCEQRY